MGTSRQYSGKRRNTKNQNGTVSNHLRCRCASCIFTGKVIIKSAKKQIETEDVYIAVCQEKITSDGFKALLNPDLFSQGKEIVMGRKC